MWHVKLNHGHGVARATARLQTEMIVALFWLVQVAEHQVAISAEHAVTEQKRLLTSEAVSEIPSHYQMNHQLRLQIEIQKPIYRRNYTPQRSEMATA